jgi:hypothetical protein
MMGQIPALLSVRVLVLKIVPKSMAYEVHPKNYISAMLEMHVLCILKFRNWWSKKKKKGRIADFCFTW